MPDPCGMRRRTSSAARTYDGALSAPFAPPCERYWPVGTSPQQARLTATEALLRSSTGTTYKGSER
jgi:hypothetical protein